LTSAATRKSTIENIAAPAPAIGPPAIATSAVGMTKYAATAIAGT
jgi:hypothetical protein